MELGPSWPGDGRLTGVWEVLGKVGWVLAWEVVRNEAGPQGQYRPSGEAAVQTGQPGRSGVWEQSPET